MIQKLQLLSAISKYYLNGMNEAVIWDIKDKELNVKFTAPSKEMLGSITFQGIPLEDSKVGISNTTQLNKLLNITSGAIELNYIKHKNTPNKFIIADKSFTLNYALADIVIIPKPGDIIGDIDFNIKANLDSESINSIIKAKTAINESETVVIKPYLNEDGEHMLELEFGGDVEHANKASYFIPNININDIPNNFKAHYNSEMIKEIMNCNKDMNQGVMCINSNGIMKLEFKTETLQSVYYIVAKEV